MNIKSFVKALYTLVFGIENPLGGRVEKVPVRVLSGRDFFRHP